MSDASLPETLVQLLEQALQPQSWTLLTWLLVIGAIVSTFTFRCLLKKIKEAYLPCVSMKKLTMMAEEVDEALKKYKDSSLMGTGTGGSWSASLQMSKSVEQWKVAMDYEERLMHIQETVLDIHLESDHILLGSAMTFSDRTRPVRWICKHFRRIRIIAKCYHQLRTLAKEIRISDCLSRRDQLHWSLHLRRARGLEIYSDLKAVAVNLT